MYIGNYHINTCKFVYIPRHTSVQKHTPVARIKGFLTKHSFYTCIISWPFQDCRFRLGLSEEEDSESDDRNVFMVIWSIHLLVMPKV